MTVRIKLLGEAGTIRVAGKIPGFNNHKLIIDHGLFRHYKRTLPKKSTGSFYPDNRESFKGI